jgi:hypothetical protein
MVYLRSVFIIRVVPCLFCLFVVRQDESPDGDGIQPKWKPISLVRKSSHTKHRPVVAGGGQNLPLAILRCLSEYVSVLDDRATMNGKIQKSSVFCG